jgi:hypothetical protein
MKSVRILGKILSASAVLTLVGGLTTACGDEVGNAEDGSVEDDGTADDPAVGGEGPTDGDAPAGADGDGMDDSDESPGAVDDDLEDDGASPGPNPDDGADPDREDESASDEGAAPDGAPPAPGLGDASGPGALPDGTDPGGVDVVCEATEPGVNPLMKLSTIQYRNSVRDLLEASGLAGVAAEAEAPLASVPEDSLGDSFRGADGRVSVEHVQGYLNVGIAVGDALLLNPSVLEGAVGACVLEDNLSDECARNFLSRFLGLAYRRPVGDADMTDTLELNDGSRSPGEAIAAMVVVALSSPRFVKHLEIDGTASDTSADILQLTSYEIASRLSYTFWQTMPDADLFAAAEDGSLATESGFEAQLIRVFDDPRTRATLWQFWNEWMKLEKFTGFETTRPAFRALSEGTQIAEAGHDYYGDMVQEIRDLTDVFTFERTATVSDLLTTDISVTQSADLAALYGVEAYSGSGEYPTLPEGTRVGIFQRGALLVSNLEQTNPFHRGAFVRRAMLCDDLPQPDPNSLPAGSLDPPPVDSAQTTRERFSAKVEGNGLCEGCHGVFSDIGYVLESFDALGRYRTTEIVYDEQTGEQLAELPLNTSAVARIDLTDDTVVTGPVDLANRLALSRKVEACLAENYFHYALRRVVERGSGDACAVADLSSLFADPAEGLASAFRRVAQYDGFFQRKVGTR